MRIGRLAANIGASLVVALVLPGNAQAAKTTVSVDLSTSVAAMPIVIAVGCLPPPSGLFGPGPDNYTYGQTSFTTGAAGNYVFEVTGLGAPSDPAILLYQGAGAFNPASPEVNLVGCVDAGGFANPVLFPRLVSPLGATAQYTVVVILPKDPGVTSGTVNADLGLGLVPTITYANKSVTLGAAGQSMTATSNSVGLISYTIQNPAVATIDVASGAITTVGTGTTQVAAIQDAEAAAGIYGSGVQEATLTVTSPSPTSQTITFNNPGAQTFGTTPTITATASSGLAVAFSSSTTGVCTITTGGTLTFVTAGTCTINADQAGNGTYAAAPTLTQSFTVNPLVPSVVSPTSGSITANSATLGGNVTSNGGAGISGRGLVYALTATNADPLIGGTGVTPVAVAGTTGSFTDVITGLLASSGYSFKAYASNSAGTAYTSVSTFTTATPDFCAASPCLNGGTCTSGPTTYTCTCTSGFSGATCALPVASKLAFVTQPSGATAGVAFTGQPSVAIQNAGGTTVTSATDTVTLAIKASTGTSGAALTCTPTAAVAGVATFAGCKIDLAGTGYVLTASANTLTAADSTAFAVVAPAPISGVSFAVAPTTAASAATMTVSFTMPTALVAGDTITAKVMGYTFTAGSVTITPGAGVSSALAGSVTAGALDTVVVTAASAIPAGTVSFSFPVTNPAAGTIAKAGLTVATSRDTTAVASSTDIVITAPPDFCIVNPCLNGGVCTNTPTTYICTCPSGFIGSVCETVAPPSKLAFAIQPSGATAGVAFTGQPKVAIQNASGGIVTSATDTVTLSIKTGTGTSGAALTCTANPIAAVAGVATFTGCKIDLAGTGYVLTASASGLTSADSTAFAVVAPATISGVSFTVSPTTPASAATMAVSFTTPTALAAGDTITAKLSGYAFSAGAVTVTAGTGVTGLLTGNVIAGAIDTVVVTVSSGGSIAAGGSATFLFPVTNPAAGTIAKAGLTVATSKNTTPVASSSDIIISAPNFCAASPCLNGGVCTSGPTTFICTCTAGFSGTNCAISAPSKLSFVTQPSGAIAGVAFTSQPVVAIQDASGATVTSAINTVAITRKSGTGTLTCGAIQVAAVAGVASFPGCKIDSAGTGYVLTASASGLPSVDSAAFDVAAASPISGVTFSVAPAIALSTAVMTVQFTPGAALTAGDTITSKLTGYALTAGAVTMTVGAPSGGSLTGSVNAGALDTVVATLPAGQSMAAGTPVRFSFPVTNPGARTVAKAGLTVATSRNTTAVASASDIVITSGSGTATKLVISTPPPSSTTSGARFSLVVTAQDAAGNVVTGRSGTVTITTQRAGDAAKLKGFLTASMVAGVASFTGLYFNEASSTGYVLVASSSGLTSAQSSPVIVSQTAAASYIAFTSRPDFEATGTAFARQPVVAAYAADAKVFPLTGTVTLSASPAPGTLTNPALSPAAALTATFVNGVAAFSGVGVTASTGSYVLTATSGTLSASTTFNVYADVTGAATARASELALSTTFVLNFEIDDVTRTSDLRSQFGASICTALGLAANCARVSVSASTSSSSSAGTMSASAAKASCPTTVVTGVGVVTVPPCMYDTPGTYRLVGTSPGFPARTSNPITVVDTLAGNLPGAPRNLKVEVGAGQAVVSWDPPETTGAGRIIAYEIFGLRDGAADQSLAKGLLTSKTLKLASGAEWRFGVKALSALGGGEMARSDLVRIGGAAAASKGVAGNAIGQAVSAESGGAAKLAVGGCTLQRAETVAVAPDQGPGTGAVMPYGATGLELTDCRGGVANVTLGYPVVVQGMQVYTLVGGRWSMLSPATPGLVVSGDTASLAVVDNGPSDADPQVGVISMVAGVGYIEAWLPELPGAPQTVTASAGSGSVTVSWTAPASGGAPVRYRVVAIPGGASCIVDAPATSCTVTGLTAGVQYTFTVVAENATGVGAASAPSAAAAAGGLGPVPVPTLSEYSLVLLVLMLMLGAWRGRDRLNARR